MGKWNPNWGKPVAEEYKTVPREQENDPENI